MSKGKWAVSAYFDPEEERRIKAYMRRQGLESPGNAVRKLAAQGVQASDPERSWLLNIGLAASMLAIAAVPGAIWWTLDWLYAAAAVYMAVLFLLAHSVQLARHYGIASVPVVGRLFGRPVDR